MEDRSNNKSSLNVTEISIPKGGGAIQSIGDTFQPNRFTGTGSFSIPIPLAKSRGFEPELSINYNSGSGNGIFGLGFSISIPKISIRTSLGIPKYDGHDNYLFNGQELVKSDKAVYQDSNGFNVCEYFLRVEGPFSLIKHHVKPDNSSSYWEVINSSNQSSLFGTSQDCCIYNPDQPYQIFEWLISQSTDAKGNKILYSYKADNLDQVPQEIWTQGHVYNNKYIQSIRYGNYLDPSSRKEKFAFNLIFNYGEYDISELNKSNKNPFLPSSSWNYRPDSFSSFSSGFEIRTTRLCQQVLVFHCIEAELGDPCLVKSLDFEYDVIQQYQGVACIGPSMLKKVVLKGYRREGQKAADHYDIQAMPSLTFGFSEFTAPEAPKFSELEADPNSIPGYINAHDFLPVDLDREGISGLLYSKDTLMYLSPEGEGRYSAPQVESSFPIDNAIGSTVSFQDLNGDGSLELVTEKGNIKGYYSRNQKGVWSNFQPFDAMPSEIDLPLLESVGLSNNGKTDLLSVEDSDLVLLESIGLEGFEAAIRIPLQDGFPSSKGNYQHELVSYSNLFGDGSAHRIRIANGAVECWPNLGYGNFAPKITLGNAPQFGNQFDKNRLFLSDIDGSGTTDLIYAHSEYVEVFFNQNGNSFSQGIKITLPEAFTDIDQIRFADILGNGTNCLVFTKIDSKPRHYYYNFIGQIEIDGKKQASLKPYLLNTVENGLGARTEIQYTASTQFYLEDKKAGTPWITKLPFPVQVVEKIIVKDQVTGARFTSRFKYHDGFYDPIERQFKGFAYVESWDSEDNNELQEAIQTTHAKAISKENFVPPVYTRNWYYTGASFQNESVYSYYQKQFYQGDKDAYNFPGPVFDPEIHQQSAETVRQAYIALSGQSLRTEVYGEDHDQNPSLSQKPFTVSQSNQYLSLYQALGDHPYAVFLVSPHESISYHYERNPEDPRVQQEFALELDQYGNVLKSCSLALARRNQSDSIVYPEQQELKASITFRSYIKPASGYLYCHQQCESQDFQLNGLSLNGASYFSFEKIKAQTAAINPSNGKNIISYSGHASGGVLARQLSWEKTFYWDMQLKAPLNLGEISPLGLVHHKEQAVFDKDFTVNVFGGRLISEKEYSDKSTESNLLYTHGGYFYDDTTEYWWNKGLVQHYFDQEAYYLPRSAENTFAIDSLGGSQPQDQSLCLKTTLEYDAYCLAQVKTMQWLDDSHSNTTEAQIDYQVLQPWQLTDINDNKHQVLFDPLGQVIVTSILGKENAKDTGGMSLYASGGTGPEYQLNKDVSFAKVVDEKTCKDYLQGATSYFYYNLQTWESHQQPVCAVELLAFNYWNSPNKNNSPYCQTTVEYMGGLGKVVESKVRTSEGMAFIREADGTLKRNASGTPIEVLSQDRWVTTSRSVLNNKAKVYEQYLPYFINSPLYQTETQVPGPPPTVSIYDALGRVVRINRPKGFFSKVEFTAWEVWHFDEDDTVLDSQYYQNNYSKVGAAEKAALDQAAQFYNTPTKQVQDNLGHKIFEIENNLGNVAEDAFESIVKGSSVSSQDLWQALKSAAYLKTDTEHPTLTFLTEKFQAYQPGFKLQLPTKYDKLLEATTDLLKQNALFSYYVPDIQGRVLQSIDPRLYYANISQAKSYYNFNYQYAMGAKEPSSIDSIDAGTKNNVSNLFNHQLWSWSPRSYCQLISYDQLQRKTSLHVKKIQSPGLVSNYASFNLVEVFSYGDSLNNASDYNLKGQLVELKDLSGIINYQGYTMFAKELSNSRQMATEYKTALDWNNPVTLNPDKYTSSFEYNALGMTLSETKADKSKISSNYSLRGLLKSINTSFSDQTSQSIIDNISYDAKGQRSLVEYGNGVQSSYQYEVTTLRLSQLKSTYIGDKASKVLQDLDYTYDPVGNVSQIVDNSIAAVFHANQKVNPILNYSYDALYRLLKATGRQHIGINANTYKNNASEGSFMESIYGPPPSINDSTKLENYSATYQYDDSGNLIAKKRTANSGNVNRLLPVEENSNRLSGYTYDESGNMRDIIINGTVQLSFNCCENLVKAATITRPGELDDADYYVYDSREMRSRKVNEQWQHQGSISQIEQKLYLDNYEVKQNFSNSISANNLNFERHSLRVMDGQQCLAIIYTITTDKKDPGKEGSRQFRFQLGNHLGSVALELDEQAQLISYEEYFPYGGTALITGESSAEVQLKEYRYAGKERDLSTGLYYYGARYYAPWLGRWIKADPAGTVDGMNVFAFVKSNPIKFHDPDGRMIKYGFEAVGMTAKYIGNSLIRTSGHQSRSLIRKTGVRHYFTVIGSGGADKEELPEVIKADNHFFKPEVDAPVIHTQFKWETTSTKHDPIVIRQPYEIKKGWEKQIYEYTRDFDVTKLPLYESDRTLASISEITGTPFQGVIFTFPRSESAMKEEDMALIREVMLSIKGMEDPVPLFLSTTDFHPTIPTGVIARIAAEEGLGSEILIPYPEDKSTRRTYSNSGKEYLDIRREVIRTLRIEAGFKLEESM
ncbi:SpvB/TcaC N-terminal domain-containing protein [Croceimicrobium hydrocarbonivorans]|uniref:Sugar-binding protein n=1 Tax=Croceimicrobium hydrocarbonivorans TaxID=2761580 RepID=A0A7H0VFQ8_9FLAO|nr:SpvB/TcaC N-terminal domain-containing protein [Croceimicrobium hydrocarbonivorans]QNR24556.1 sugar-binding protein [Croceimicrobium hydrocarbonivorans]